MYAAHAAATQSASLMYEAHAATMTARLMCAAYAAGRISVAVCGADTERPPCGRVRKAGAEKAKLILRAAFA